MGPGILNFPCDTSAAGLWTTLGVKKCFSTSKFYVRKLNRYNTTFLIFHLFACFLKRKKNLILKIDVVKISLFIKYFFQIAIALPGAICGFCTKKNPYKGSIKKPT